MFNWKPRQTRAVGYACTFLLAALDPWISISLGLLLTTLDLIDSGFERPTDDT